SSAGVLVYMRAPRQGRDARADARSAVRRVRGPHRLPGRLRAGSRRRLPASPLYRGLDVMQQRPPQKPQAPNWSGLSKNLALWLLVALLAVAIVQLMGKTRGAPGQLNYTEFSQQLDAGNIKSVEVYNGKEVKGEFRRAVPSGTTQVRNF